MLLRMIVAKTRCLSRVCVCVCMLTNIRKLLIQVVHGVLSPLYLYANEFVCLFILCSFELIN